MVNEIKMSDVFNLPVKDVVDIYGSANILDALSECISDGYYDDFEKSAAHAINNHDRLVEENKRLREFAKTIADSSEMQNMAFAREDAIELLSELGGDK